jgi:hypothetical protein
MAVKIKEIKQKALIESLYNDVDKLHEKAKQIQGPFVVYVETLKQKLIDYKQNPIKYLKIK